MQKYKVIWDDFAKDSLKSIVAYIKEDSPTAARNVKRELLNTAKSLSDKPNRFSKEYNLNLKKGNYRSVRRWFYKILYKVTDQHVYILDVFHTRKDPSEIEELD